MEIHLLPTSHRSRRRIALGAGLAGVAAGVALLVVFVPGHPGRAPSPPGAEPGPARSQRPARAERPVALSLTDRRAIDRVLDRFVPAAVGRRHPGTAYDLAAPSLRAGTTRAEWAKGTLPVYPYEPRGTRFHDWTPSLSYRNRTIFDLLLHPAAGSTLGPLAYTVEMERVRGRWLVASFMPTATFAGAGARSSIVAQPDLAPGPPDRSGKSQLSAVWLVVPTAMLGLGLLVPLALLGLRGWRARRLWRDVGGRRELPPLPSRDPR